MKLLPFAVFLLLPASAPAQSFHSESDLITIDFSVLHKGRPVDTLQTGDIQILENGVPRTVAFFERTRQPQPVDVVLLFDQGWQMHKSNGDHPGAIAEQLLQGAPNIRIGIYGFGDQLYRLIRPTHNVDELQKAAKRLADIPFTPHRVAPIYRSVIQTMQEEVGLDGVGSGRVSSGGLNSVGSNRRILLVFTQGLDHACELPGNDRTEAFRLAGDYGFTIFPVLLPVPVAGRVDQVSLLYRSQLSEMAKATGGMGILRTDASTVAISEAVGIALKQVEPRYTAGFYPEQTASAGELDRIEVKLSNQAAGQVQGGVRLVAHP